MNFEETIQKMISEEFDRREKSASIIPVAEFCKTHNLSRVTVWRAEREGKLQTTRIGRKVFVKANQF